MTKSRARDVGRRAASWLAGALVVSAVVVVSCSDGANGAIPEDVDLNAEIDGATPDAPPPPVTIAQACAALVGGLCDRYDTCAGPLIQLSWGDATTCKARLTADCERNLAAIGTGATPDAYKACGGAYGAALCHYLFAGNTPACLPPPGNLPLGAACRNESQCSTSFCVRQGFCGTCAVPPRENEACVMGQCPAGLACNGTACVRILGAGDDCDGAHPCSLELSCTGGTCLAGAKAGEACGGDAPNCDGSKVMRCVGDPAKCVPYKFAATGAPCGDIAGDAVLCLGTDYCKPVVPATDPPTPGTCTKRAADGAACNDDPAKGTPCQAPAACINALCMYPDPAACGLDAAAGDGG